jgi:nitroreductase
MMSGVGLLEGLATTRTIRRYTNEPVLRDGPTATEARSLLGESFRSSWATKRAADGYEAAPAADTPKGRMAATMQHFVDHLEAVPVIVLVCLQRYRAANPYEGASVYPATQNLLLAARALGYGGALTMWHQAVEPQLRAVLHVPDNVALSACITLGRPAGAHGPVRRRPLHDVVFDDAWGEPAAWASDPPGTAHTRWK